MKLSKYMYPTTGSQDIVWRRRRRQRRHWRRRQRDPHQKSICSHHLRQSHKGGRGGWGGHKLWKQSRRAWPDLNNASISYIKWTKHLNLSRTCHMFSHSSLSPSIMEGPRASPALLIQTSTPPQCSLIVSNIFMISSLLRRSHLTGNISPELSETLDARAWNVKEALFSCFHYGHSLPSIDSSRAVVSFWRKNVHNTG